MTRLSDEDFMRLALAEAQKAAELGEVPVGAVVALDGEIEFLGRHAMAVIGDADQFHASLF